MLAYELWRTLKSTLRRTRTLPEHGTPPGYIVHGDTLRRKPSNYPAGNEAGDPAIITTIRVQREAGRKGYEK
ncbi:hypothetical protein ACFLQN_01500 [Candidatus Aenigmatarchaeota archaeon]